MSHNLLMGLSAVLSGVNLVVLVTLAVKAGYWAGDMKARVIRIEKTVYKEE